MKSKAEKIMSIVSPHEAILLTCEQSLRWLSGLSFTDGYAVITDCRCFLFADFRYIEAARAKVKPPIEVVLLSRGSAHAGEVFVSAEIKQVIYEDKYMTCAEFGKWKKRFPDIEFQGGSERIDKLREFKDADELKLIIAAQRIAEKAYTHILDFINPQRTEAEVALELDYFMRREGATGISFETIAVSGKASSQPHGVPRNVPLEPGFLTMDYGAEIDGYRSDMTRTVCLGHADEKMKHVYETVLRAQIAAEDMLCAGVLCRDADKTARDIIEAEGFGNCFGHGLGHGVGLFIHENPRLSPSSGESVLSPGHVVTVEPGIYIEGQFGVRIEDMVFIQEDGISKNLTNCPKGLVEL